MKIQITVLRRMSNQDLADQFQHEATIPCPLFEDGQVFTLDRWDEPPEGFCEWAWEDIYEKMMKVTGEATFIPEPIKERGMMIACCTDGFRPVVFKMVRID